METLIEVGDFLVPNDIALSHLIELVLDLGREVVVHDVGEILHQEVVYYHAHIGGDEFALLDTEELTLLARGDLAVLERDDFIFTLVALVLALLDIIALLNG